MLTPGYRWYVGDLRTGKIWRQVDFPGGKWSSPFSGGDGSLESSFPTKAPDWPTVRSDTPVAKAFLAVSYVNAAGDETFIEGGPIWKSSFTDDGSSILKLAAAGLWSYFDSRKVIPVLLATDNPAEATVTYTGAQLSLIAKRLVELAQSHTGGNLPIVLPTDAELGGAGAVHTRTYPGYELAWVGERLKQLTEIKDYGPEIQFVPQRNPADPRFIQWAMHIGVAPSMLLTQSGPAWVFDRSVPKSHVRSIGVEADGTGIASRQWAAGQGEAEGRPIVKADSDTLVDDFGFPLLEGEVTSTDSVTTTDVLLGHATEALAYSERPIEAWVVKVSRDGRPNVGQYRPGDWATVKIKDHDYLPDDTYDMRVLNIAGDSDDAVTLTMSERLGAF